MKNDVTPRPFPSCVAQERGRGESQQAFRALHDLVEKERLRAGYTVEQVTPAWLVTLPLLQDVLGISWAYQQQHYKGTHTALTLEGHASTQQLWQHARWVGGGRRIYELGETLAAGLLETTMSVALEDIPTPVESYYLMVPEALGLTVYNPVTGEHPLDGFYVTRTPLGVYFLAAGRAHPGADVSDNALVSYVIPAGVRDVEQWLTEAAEQRTTKRGLGENNVRMALWARLVLGFELYLATGDADSSKERFGPSPETRKKAKVLGGKAGKRLLDAATLPVYYVKVGFRVARDESLVAYAGADEETRTLTKRFIVRGHYRNQAHGPARKDRKIIYVKPHWKGPPWAEAVGTRIHRVDTTNKDQ